MDRYVTGWHKTIAAIGRLHWSGCPRRGIFLPPRYDSHAVTRRRTTAGWLFRQIVGTLSVFSHFFWSCPFFFPIKSSQKKPRTVSADGVTGTYDLGQAASITTGEYRLCWCQASTRPCTSAEAGGGFCQLFMQDKDK